MTTKLIALCAISGLCACLQAAEVTDAPLAIYYSFESSPPDNLFASMQTELTRILAPAKLQVVWRSIENRAVSDEAFREIVVVRFRGACRFDETISPQDSIAEAAGLALAETELVDGHILPFGEVQCDQLRRYLAPMEAKPNPQRENSALGRAMARVTAHEIYHMLTGSMTHSHSGIARAEHSRAELTASSFSFAKSDTQWLRAWAQQKTLDNLTVARQPAPAALVAQESDHDNTTGSAGIVTLDSK